jgi:hypothetical protein
MATVTLYKASDMYNAYVWYGVVQSYDTSHITLSDGYYSGTYFGSFTYNAYGLSGGLLLVTPAMKVVFRHGQLRVPMQAH